MQVRQNPQLNGSDQRFGGKFLLENPGKLVAETVATDAFTDLGPDRRQQLDFRFPFQAKPQPLFVPHGAEQASGVVPKAAGMEGTNQAIMQVNSSSQRVVKSRVAAQGQGHGIDGKVSAGQVFVKGSRLNLRQSTRHRICLPPGGD